MQKYLVVRQNRSRAEEAEQITQNEQNKQSQTVFCWPGVVHVRVCRANATSCIHVLWNQQQAADKTVAV